MPAVDDRIARASAYVEPALLDVIQQEAQKKDVPISTWLRSLIIEKLLADKAITQELLIQLASK